jgi:hypothetical protein
LVYPSSSTTSARILLAKEKHRRIQTNTVGIRIGRGSF